jgi:hypothetical protein
LSYFSLHSASLLESGEVVLVFTGYEITLRGSGLEQLPEDFILHKILRVKKSSSRCDLFDSANAESIEAIQITKSE